RSGSREAPPGPPCWGGAPGGGGRGAPGGRSRCVPLRPPRRPARARHYLRPGGPWDVPALDVVLGPPGDPDGVARLAGGLRAEGVRRGDVVGWQLPNRPEAVLLYRACWLLGAVAAPVHHQAGPRDVEAMLGQV